MPHEMTIWDETYLANADLSAKRFFAVEDVSAGKVDLCNNAGDKTCGILQNQPKAGEAANVRHLGISKAVTDGNAAAIAVGDQLGTNAAGKLVKKTANNDWIIAQALEASTADGTIISVRMTGGYYLGV